MPREKSEFDAVYPCDFYAPADLLDAGKMYTVYEIARLLQDLDPDAELDEGTEEVLLDWAIPWVIQHADDLVIAEPPTDADPGYYGLREPDEFDETNDVNETSDVNEMSDVNETSNTDETDDADESDNPSPSTEEHR